MSSWWENIGRVGRGSGGLDWFAEGVKRKVCRGDKTRFWKDVWVGEKSLKKIFPRLFYIS